MAVIGPRVIQKVNSKIATMMHDYQQEMDEAYATLEEEKLKVTLGVTFKPAPGKGIGYVVEIGFTKDKVKDSGSGTADEHQRELPFGGVRNELLYRDFSELAAEIGKRLAYWMAEYKHANNPRLRIVRLAA